MVRPFVCGFFTLAAGCAEPATSPPVSSPTADTGLSAPTGPAPKAYTLDAPPGGTCDPAPHIYPFPGEERHWAAIVFPVPADGVVSEVRYALRNGPSGDITLGVLTECDASLAHAVAVWAQPDPIPAAEPPGWAVFERPAGVASSNSFVEFTFALPDDAAPVHVSAGEYLAFAVQQGTEEYVRQEDGTWWSARATCPRACDVAEAQFSWWSNGDAPPFPWATLSSFGILMEYDIFVDIEPAP